MVIKRITFIFIFIFGVPAFADCQITLDSVCTGQFKELTFREESAMRSCESFLARAHLGMTLLSRNGQMGIYLITQFTNKEGKACWRVETCYDDTYRLFSPTAYTVVGIGNRVALIYSGDEKGNKTTPRASGGVPFRCVELMVGDRVFIRPPQQQRFIYNRTSRTWEKELPAIEHPSNGVVLIIFDSTGDGYKLQVEV